MSFPIKCVFDTGLRLESNYIVIIVYDKDSHAKIHDATLMSMNPNKIQKFNINKINKILDIGMRVQSIPQYYVLDIFDDTQKITSVYLDEPSFIILSDANKIVEA